MEDNRLRSDMWIDVQHERSVRRDKFTGLPKRQRADKVQIALPLSDRGVTGPITNPVEPDGGEVTYNL